MRDGIASFTFVPDIDTFDVNADTLMVRIPPDIAEKHQLLRTFAEQMKFPSYFGWNWDALYDLLCDLSWIQTRHIAIIHHDLPLRFERKEVRIYLEILRDAIDSWKTDTRHEFLAVFSTAYRKSMKEILQE